MIKIIIKLLYIYFFSLPFYFLKLSFLGGLSINQIVSVLIIIFFIFYLIKNPIIFSNKIYNSFLLLIFIYSVFLIGNFNEWFVLVKNLLNVAFLGVLINLNKKIGFTQYSNIIILGFSLGMLVLVAIFFISNYSLFVFTNFSYYKLTYGLFLNVYEFLNIGLEEDFNSSLIFRNTYGEIFAVLYLLVSNTPFRKMRVVYFLFTLISFSRRAIFTLIWYFSKYMKLKYILPIFLILFLFLNFNIFENNRVFSFEEETRLDQYINVFGSIDNVFLGAGFAESFEGRYIHNFILSNFYTIGVIGLLISCWIYILLVKSFFDSFISSNYLYSSLFILVILNLTVSSNVNGLLTPGAIIALSIASLKI